MPERGDLLEEANRQLAICNACRYCEGYCAVFPALERQPIVFAAEGPRVGGLSLLANLCHDCRACAQACMYAAPHELAVDIPALLADVRKETYRRHVWPGAMGALLRRPATATAGATALSGLAALTAVAFQGGLARLFRVETGPGAFYRLIAYEVLLVAGLSLSGAAAAALLAAFWGFWRECGGTWRQLTDGRLWLGTLRDVAVLRHLGGGGGGCYHPDPGQPSQARRVLHQLVLAGFALSFAATLAAAVEQDLLGRPAPYPVLSVPVLLGAAGGVGMVAGASGLLWLRARAPSGARALSASRPLDLTLLVMIQTVAGTGLLLLWLRETPAMGTLLVLHLAAVAGLFLTAPYGKIVHAPIRLAALLRDRVQASHTRSRTGPG